MVCLTSAWVTGRLQSTVSSCIASCADAALVGDSHQHAGPDGAQEQHGPLPG